MGLGHKTLNDDGCLALSYRNGALLCLVTIAISACASKVESDKTPPNEVPSGYKIDTAAQVSSRVGDEQAEINNVTKFSSQEFGVKGSPRVTSAKQVRKGGGRYQIGKPYTIRGIRYYPKEDKNLNQVGIASWYGPNFHGRLTANGEVYDQYGLSAAHPTMPLPSYAKVTNLENGRSLTVRVNDRGPYSKGRVIDLSAQAAKLLDYTHKGVARVRVQYVGKARMDGLDGNVLMTSYQGPALKQPALTNQSNESILVASANPSDRRQKNVLPAMNSHLSSLQSIDRNFSQNPNRVVPISNVPVPVSSPLFEQQKATGNIYGSVRRPLAFSNAEKFEDYLSYKDKYILNYNRIKTYIDKMVEIEIGQFKSNYDVILLSSQLGNTIKLRESKGIIVALAPAKEVNILLDYAAYLGIAHATIR